MFLNLIILWLLVYIWYDIIKNWNPIMGFLLIIIWTLLSIFNKYNYFLLLISSIYFFFDYTLNYWIKKDEIQKKVNKKLEEKNNIDIIKYLV